jgi:hypothetical protein
VFWVPVSAPRFLLAFLSCARARPVFDFHLRALGLAGRVFVPQPSRRVPIFFTLRRRCSFFSHNSRRPGFLSCGSPEAHCLAPPPGSIFVEVRRRSFCFFSTPVRCGSSCRRRPGFVHADSCGARVRQSRLLPQARRLELLSFHALGFGAAAGCVLPCLRFGFYSRR